MNKLKSNIIISTIYQALSLALPFVTAPYVSRVLEVDGMGTYSYTQSYVAFFSLFAMLGTNSYGTREIARNREKIVVRSQLFWEIEGLSIFTSLITIIVWIIWILFNSKYCVIFSIMTICLIGSMLDISWFFAGLEEFKYSIVQNVFFKILGIFCIFFYVNNSTDLWKYVLISSLIFFLSNASLWIYLNKFICPISIKLLKPFRHLKNTIVFFLPTIAVSFYTILDKTFIGIITKIPSENGHYEQATKIINMSKTLSFAGLNAVFQSRMSFLFAEKNFELIKKHISDSMEYIFFMGFGMCFGIIGIADKFVPIFFGNGYEKTIILLELLAPMIIVTGISNCLGAQFYIPAGYRSKSAKFIIIGSLINMLLNIFLIPYFKSIGAVIATIIAESFITILYLLNCDQYYTIKQLIKQIFKKLFAGIVMCFLIKYLGRIISESYLAFICQFIIGLSVYIIILIILKDDFFVIIKNIIKKDML